MAKNAPYWDDHRHWAVKNRDQVYNPQNDRWVKRDEKWKFIDQKTDNDPFKWVRKIEPKKNNK
jgi:hypothetical protein